MARPAAKDLTERELEVMHVFWKHGEATAAEARDRLAAAGLDRTYPTIANLVRILLEKGFLDRSRRAAVPLPSRCGRTRRCPAGCWATCCSASSAARASNCSSGWSANGNSRPRNGPSSKQS